MKGLLIKDVYTLTRQMKIFLLLIVAFSVMPGFSSSAFAIVYAAMLPVTALAYDERSKWDTLAAMMPYSTRELVWSKYVLGFLSVGCAGALSLAARVLLAAVRHTPAGAVLTDLPGVLCVAAVLLAVTLPFMFRFGVEKGRLGFMALMVVAMAAGTAGINALEEAIENARVSPAALALTVGAAVILLTLGSVELSIRLYRRHSA